MKGTLRKKRMSISGSRRRVSTWKSVTAESTETTNMATIVGEPQPFEGPSMTP